MKQRKSNGSATELLLLYDYLQTSLHEKVNLFFCNVSPQCYNNQIEKGAF